MLRLCGLNAFEGHESCPERILKCQRFLMRMESGKDTPHTTLAEEEGEEGMLMSTVVQRGDNVVVLTVLAVVTVMVTGILADEVLS
ncbi:hypothetical protein ACOMHN_026420 [Nucella lapillus]